MIPMDTSLHCPVCDWAVDLATITGAPTLLVRPSGEMEFVQTTMEKAQADLEAHRLEVHQ